MLLPGAVAPDFELPNQDGQPVRLATVLATGPLLLYFYPADFTPGCTAEACSFRDVHDELLTAGYHLLGISPQSVESHARFRAAQRLPFDLLADPAKTVIRAYGALGAFGLLVRRVTYLIDPGGLIRERTVADLRVARHRELVDRLLAAGPAGAMGRGQADE
ncbi:MAG: peroxiredoxin [Fimbriimonadaceae bacterium]|nr:peroxiredoxin [Fimbriimonadaceae bacterium]